MVRPLLWIAAACLAVIAFALLMHKPARAHDHNRPDMDMWFRSLSSVGRGPCCTGEDGIQVKDVDWKTDTEGCEVTTVGNEQDNPVGHMCVRLDKRWFLVPDRAIVEMPNRLGPAIVWPVWYGDSEDAHKNLFIRCFLPGAGT